MLGVIRCVGPRAGTRGGPDQFHGLRACFRSGLLPLLLMLALTVSTATAFCAPPSLARAFVYSGTQQRRPPAVTVCARRGDKQPANKGFGAVPPPRARPAGGQKAKEPPSSAAQSALTVSPALLNLIAEAPQRRAAREQMLAARGQELKDALDTGTYTVIDGLLGETMSAAMRAEAMLLLGDKALSAEISDTDTRAASVIIEPELFMQAPLCTEYVLDCAKVPPHPCPCASRAHARACMHAHTLIPAPRCLPRC